MEFDFRDHQLRIRDCSGAERTVALAPKPVAQFYVETTAALRELDLDVRIRTTPTEVERAIPFEDDYEHASYDPDAAHLFWRQLLQAHRVLSEFRSRFIGKVSPVHFFWGSFDMALTRFSGRTAPTHPGGAPNCGDWVMVEGYSHELASCGFWPGGGEEGAFYAYAYPEPDGFADHPVLPDAASYSPAAGRFQLPTRQSAPRPTPTGRCSISCKPPTKPPPSTDAGTEPRSRMTPTGEPHLDELMNDPRDGRGQVQPAHRPGRPPVPALGVSLPSGNHASLCAAPVGSRRE